jgi:hypothetical protein
VFRRSILSREYLGDEAVNAFVNDEAGSPAAVQNEIVC